MKRFASLLVCIGIALTTSLRPILAGESPPTSLVAGVDTSLRGEVVPQAITNIRQVTSGFVKAGEGYFSPDGRDIVYQAQPLEYPFYQIYTQPLDGSAEPRLLSTGRGRTTCAYFSPDGKHILYASSHLDPQMTQTEDEARRQEREQQQSGQSRRYEWNFDPYTDIFVVDRDGSNLTRLTDAPGYDAEGAYSKDGKQIAFCSTRDGDPDIYIMNSDGSEVRQLTNAPGYDGGPFMSPDGSWVVFRSDRKQEGHLQLYVVSTNGKLEMPLTDNAGVNWAPYWHPTKPYLVWTGADHSNPNARPNYDLWLMRYRQTDKQIVPEKIWRLTDHPAADVLPVFSPDGKQLLWTSNRTPDRSSQLFLADLELPE